MKKYYIAICIAITLMFTGCSKNESTFDKAMSEGKLAIASEEYEKAEGMFNLALDEKKDNKEAKALYEQTSKYIEATKFKDEKELDKAIDLCSQIEVIKSESTAVIDKAKVLKEELLNLNKDYIDSINKSISEAESLIENKKYNEAKEILNKLLEDINNNDKFSEQIKKINNLIETCSTSIELQKKEEQEVAKQESIKVNKSENKNKNKTLCPSCGKNYLEDNEFWVGEDKCDDCINEIVNAHADNYFCEICEVKTESLCENDGCVPLCDEHQGEYCEGNI